MNEKKKEVFRKALELAMENSENITITQSNKVIAQVKKEPEVPKPELVTLEKKMLEQWMSMLTVVIQDVLHQTSQGRMRFRYAAKITNGLDSIREGIWDEVNLEFGNTSYRKDGIVRGQMEDGNAYWEHSGAGYLPDYNYYNE